MTEELNPTPDTANETPDAPKGERIAKFLARAGVASRRDVERMIEDNRIKLGGHPVTHPATFVQPGDIVLVDGKPVDNPERTRLWRYHKPDGLLTTHRDPQERKTVFDSLPEGMPRVISVGRLDINSEGLLLLTNDGELARRLELPGNAWVRRYRVRVFGVVDEKRLASLVNGFEYEGVKYGSIEAELDSKKGDNSWLTVSLREGKNREIRRVMQGLNLHVSRLIRLSYGPFQLGSLKARELEEVNGKTLREQIPDLPAPTRKRTR
ncbi:tRNA/rRNA pseudouridine synthase [Gluconobacter thailandicus F149-1 = NBRC 100600]|uniref:Pseudouridine synthase n=1 Tax=Gluconobacter thailandicus NBRC 3257 TaxID=1381097 RepID=A0ABQ0IV50_GLUTH|nr:pseudouridine synthase [Gluconobacter thailandicus]AFW00968.1 tRNA pseudouridine synthase A [Gluconobacter oxydans H24]ANQ40377.1 pseudouridine synthase [Gluconobacter oxydans]GAN90306.1 tRNA/rRNA pseudouridine synthase [Gluconobacter frateurii M-2]KXV52112.1 pseudouridine synthase [Gluconobacter thailandicus]GAC86510.1 tRNA pseudouridine synthase A [Gluconobacter thailandicus NBRC 3255]